ncbi:MAG TPA: hypothetical protein VM425_10335 [Myxococcota bacterium]|nr:hypothetical protein [Myxococcota bacterium]
MTRFLFIKLLLVAAVILFAGCGGESAQTCTTKTTTPLNGDAFTGTGCAGIADNLVLLNSDESNAHNEAYCDALQICSPGSGCPGGPGFATGMMIVYVYGTAGGCEAEASIEDVRFCPTQLEVDYRVAGSGNCETWVNAWASVWVEASQLPVKFNELP